MTITCCNIYSESILAIYHIFFDMDLIIGAGLAGLSVAHHTKEKYRILEKGQSVGGLCKSISVENYIFDLGSHILFTNNDYVKKLYLTELKDNYNEQIRKAFIYLNDTYVKYPFEVNLYPLPDEIIRECIDGVIKKANITPLNFLEWIKTTFGEGIAKYYMLPYNEKIWKYPLEKMNVEWIAGRVPSPSVNDMKRGAESEISRSYGPNAMFGYPKFGGIGALINKMANGKNIQLNSNVTEIKVSKKDILVTYSTEKENHSLHTQKVYSSIPLPEIVKLLDNPPKEVIEASNKLVYNGLVCVMIGVNRPNITDKHWLYFPEKELIFNRISFPMNYSQYTTPNKKSSILAEVTYRKNPIDLHEVEKRVLKDLIKIKILKEDDIIDVCKSLKFKYAYVIYDLNHNKNVNIIHRYLRKNNIIPIGRFGEWEYYNMDKTIISGKNAVIT
jgi:protoporphyrinogen oxidase